MNGQTKLPPYLPYPRFLLGMNLTHTAKLLYSLLLDRANLSQANGWIDEQGRTFLIFPIEKISEALDKSRMTVKNALNELSATGLIERQRQGFSSPNRIYVLIPDGQEIVLMRDKKLSLISKENCPSDGQKLVPMTDRKLSPNHLSNNNLNMNHLSGERTPRTAYGRYENVMLSEKELEELKTELSDNADYYIERLSEYIASKGAKYANHAVTIRKWAAEDNAKNEQNKLTTLTCKEGTSL